MASYEIYRSNDQYLAVVVRNAEDGSYINDATVQVTLYTSAGVEVSGSWPATMTYKSSSNGVYEYTLQNTLSLTAGDNYYAIVTADGDSLQGEIRIDFRAKTRTG